MKMTALSEGPTRMWAIVLDPDEEVVATLERCAADEQMTAASVSGIGAFSQVTLGYFDWQAKDYVRTTLDEQVEVVSLLGDLALGPEGNVTFHGHVVVGRHDTTVRGGHLLAGSVRPTLELIVTESPRRLQRVHDETTGLALIDTRRTADD
jgi:uncharacterized protein